MTRDYIGLFTDEEVGVQQLAGEAAVVDSRHDVERFAALLEVGDERQEQIALQPALVQLVGRAVGRRDLQEARQEESPHARGFSTLVLSLPRVK